MDNRAVEQQPRNLNTLLLRRLSAAVNGHAATATFACGGSIPIVDSIDPGKNAICAPVKLRCDFALLNDDASITFPQYSDDYGFSDKLMALLKRCEPATFGVRGRDVLDEGYRKASKLDPTRFSTNFHPHDCGILDSIQQILLPSTVRGGLELAVGPQAIKAELYKLNIYSGPSGGTLRVKHRGQTIDFDWAKASGENVIQWAAFYGDCEHEVMEVTAGNRVTLTYNLYYSRVGETDRGVHLPHQLPLYNIVRDMLQEPTFLRNGGLIGFFCHHQYAHAHGSGRKSLPHAFKGVDLAVYSVFHSLRLKAGVHPIIKNKSGEMGGMSMRELMHDIHYGRPGDHVELFLQDLEERPGTGDNDSEDYDWDDEKEFTTYVGTSLHGPTFDCLENGSGEYGNQAELNYQFSAAAIIVVVPPSSARMMAPPPLSTDAEVLDAGEPPSSLQVHPGRLLDKSMIFSDDDTSEETATFGSPPPIIDLT
ncbi:MAG: hypothetical protein LQ348_006656 [Seirophora lacunosa]|nr:MAG: hypothetical protein LQ348_006656 [Seirophora lacunosa]